MKDYTEHLLFAASLVAMAAWWLGSGVLIVGGLIGDLPWWMPLCGVAGLVLAIGTVSWLVQTPSKDEQ